jgi:hypothetical protein
MQLARRRLRVARWSIGALALSAFAAFGFVVRGAHPATHATTSTAPAAVADSSTSLGGSGAISPAPQSAVPQVQSAGS